jgi:hypothetical protein
MKAKTEIYSVKFNKYTQPNGDVAFSLYTIGVTYTVADKEITPTKIEIVKDRIKVSFEDGGKHTFGYGADVEIFERPIETIKPKTDDGSTTEAEDN